MPTGRRARRRRRARGRSTYASSTQLRRRGRRSACAVGVEVAHARPDLDQALEVEAGQADLHRARVVEARVAGEVGVQPLGQRRQPLHALRAVEEGRRAGDDQVQAGEAPAVDLVDQLAQRVERLLAHVAADRCSVSTSSSTSTARRGRRRAGRRAGPGGSPSAPKWSSSPLTPAARLTAAATFGCPPSQASRPSAIAASPAASAAR